MNVRVIEALTAAKAAVDKTFGHQNAFFIDGTGNEITAIGVFSECNGLHKEFFGQQALLNADAVFCVHPNNMPSVEVKKINVEGVSYLMSKPLESDFELVIPLNKVGNSEPISFLRDE